MNDYQCMDLAIQEAQQCPPSKTAYSVGCVIVREGMILSSGYSREDGATVHAEESALEKLAGHAQGATVYSTMEPCSRRVSRPNPCAQLIIQSGASKVVYGCDEPPHFVADCKGVELLRDAGIEVVHLQSYTARCLALNDHITCK